MSSGVTPTVRPPIVIAGLVESGVVMPIRWASRAICCGADLEADFGVDRVVGEGGRAGQGVRARCRRLRRCGRRTFRRRWGCGTMNVLLLGGPHRVGRDAVLERGGEVEGLERRARLALALGGEVERAFVVVAPADHRAHLAGRVFDRDQRGGRAFGVGEVVVDGLFGGALQFEVERRLDLQAAVEGALGAVAFDHLLLHPAREVAGVDAFDRSAPAGAWISAAEGSGCLTLSS